MTDEETRRAAVRRMLEARSVAVVGASVKPGSLGAQMVAELRRGRYEGAVYPVNPGYEEIDGLRCYPSIGDIAEAVDVAVLGVATARVEQAMLDAAAAGAGSIVTFSPLFEEPSDGPDLRERLATIAAEHGMAMCGGNGMGFLNLDHRLRVTGFLTGERLEPGPIALLSHSGSAFAAFGWNDRSLGFNLIVSCGAEVVTTMAEYAAYALEQPTTRVLGLMLETVRDPARFRWVLEEANRRDIPVVAIKMGRTAAASSMVQAHSGALAGEHGAFEALFDATGVHECRTFTEMADTLELFAAGRRVRGGNGIATIHDSGGERSMLVDLASDVGVPFATMSEASLARIDEILDLGWEAANPLDAWGTGIDADEVFHESFRVMGADPAVSAMAFVVDMTAQGEPYEEGYLQIALDAAAGTDKPFAVLSNLHSAIARDEVQRLRDAKIPILEGTESGLRALGHLLEDAEWRARPAEPPPEPVSDEVRRRWRERVESGRPLGERDGLAMLADYGVPVVRSEAASTPQEAVEAADAIGYPVVLKTAAPGISHKSDVDGVRLGLEDAEAVRDAYADVTARLGPEVAIAAMAPRGVEVALGIVRDPMFGPLVLAAAGGILIELMKDRRLALPPIGEAAARRLIDGLSMRPMLDGIRGSEPSDVGALARAVSRLSVLAADLGDRLDALDVNPMIVSARGCVAVDALVVARS